MRGEGMRWLASASSVPWGRGVSHVALGVLPMVHASAAHQSHLRRPVAYVILTLYEIGG